jgi:hypothetical protein
MVAPDTYTATAGRRVVHVVTDKTMPECGVGYMAEAVATFEGGTCKRALVVWREHGDDGWETAALDAAGIADDHALQAAAQSVADSAADGLADRPDLFEEFTRLEAEAA